jgi:hypothetical protein
MPGQPPARTKASLWQIPHAATLMSTSRDAGVGISRSTNSNGAPAAGTSMTFIFFAFRFDTVVSGMGGVRSPR